MTEPAATSSAPSYIIEIERDEIELVAATAHLLLFHFPENTTAIRLIRHLVEQTDFVTSNPDAHGLNFQLKQPLTSQQKWGHLTGVMELSNLQQLITNQDF